MASDGRQARIQPITATITVFALAESGAEGATTRGCGEDFFEGADMLHFMTDVSV
jgi:hypothetical protein